MKPNKRLKQEREQRGWSQAKLAELVGTNPATVGRWERGISAPYPIYRERLALIFNKNVQELGLVAADESVVVQADLTLSDSLSHVLPPPQPFIFDPAIPMFPFEIGTLIGRDELLAQLKRQLYAEEAIGISALSGLPGVGKTTLALALAYDREVQSYFHDGILWAGLGIKPDVQEIQSRWGAQLGLSAVEITNIKSSDDWAGTLRALIGTRQLLLIIDDVWETEDVLAFQVGGPHCMYLFTTRFPQIAIEIAGSNTVAVSELNEENGLALLAHFAPQLVEQDKVTARRLVNSVGALPLALVLMGRHLRSHFYNGQPRRLRRALQDLSDTEKRMHLNDLPGLSRPHSSYSGRTRYSLQSVIALSDERLDARAKRMLRAVAVFPPKPNTFSEEAATVISEQPVEMLDILCDMGLLESSGPERYMMHQTIADYARAQMGQSQAALYERMIMYVIQYIEMHKNDYDELEREYANIQHALEEASRYGMEVEFVQGVNAFVPFLRIRGLYREALLYLKQAYQMIQNLSDSFEKMEILSYLGHIMLDLNEYKQAESYLQEGLLLARVKKQAEYVSLLLGCLGKVMERLGEYRQAEILLWEGLTLARQLDLSERICQILITLGWTAANEGKPALAEPLLSEALQLARQLEHKEYIMGILNQFGTISLSKEDYTLAIAYFLEALALAYQIGYQEYIIGLCVNLSGVLGVLGDYKQSDHYLQKGLDLAYKIGSRANIVMLLNNLGSVDWMRGRYEQAQTHLEEALILAREINDPRLINNILYEQGEVALSTQKYDRAEVLFKEAFTHATLFPEICANAHYGLARVLAVRGDLTEAQLHGEISAEIFEASGLPKAGTIRNWLTTLSPTYKEVR